MEKIHFLTFVIMISLLLSQLVKAETVEVVVFKTKDTISSSQLIHSASLMQETLRKWDGFISRELVKVSDTTWIDVVHWENQSAAKSAQEKAMKSSVCLTFFNLIDNKQQQFYHGEILLKQN